MKFETGRDCAMQYGARGYRIGGCLCSDPRRAGYAHVHGERWSKRIPGQGGLLAAPCATTEVDSSEFAGLIPSTEPYCGSPNRSSSKHPCRHRSRTVRGVLGRNGAPRSLVRPVHGNCSTLTTDTFKLLGSHIRRLWDSFAGLGSFVWALTQCRVRKVGGTCFHY